MLTGLQFLISNLKSSALKMKSLQFISNLWSNVWNLKSRLHVRITNINMGEMYRTGHKTLQQASFKKTERDRERNLLRPIKITVFWDETPCSLTESDENFGGTHCLIFLIGIVGRGGGGVQLGPLCTAATNRPIVPAPGDYDDDGEIGGMISRGNRSTRRKSAPVTNPTCCPDANPGRRGRKPATNRNPLPTSSESDHEIDGKTPQFASFIERKRWIYYDLWKLLSYGT
jgi:hypothetical protein